ncbi:MAG: glycosyltransferase family 2 protein [Thermoleophilaceae bacterium]|nr:glycosyltransferase family 2 protein [Thermoleophilaceae bacterium]
MGRPGAAGAAELEVVIVSAGAGRELLRACLASLQRHPLTSDEMRVTVVDNASRDGTVEMARSEFPDVTVVGLDWNAGFCHANNLALRRATAPYVLLLNPDTEATADALDHMVALMRERPEIGVAGCRLVRRDGSFDHAAKRSFPTPLGALAHFTGVGRRAAAHGRLSQYRATDLDEQAAGEVDAVNGAFMLVRRAAMREVGLLDEAYWTYMEDLDWCYRFRASGWSVFYDGRATFVHVKGGTSVVGAGHRRLRPNIAFHRGMGRFYRKFYAGRRPAFDALVYAAIGAKLLIAASRSAIARRSLR